MSFSKIVLFLLVALQLQQTALACRAFGYGSNGQRFTAKSFDFDLGHGRAFVNLRGKEKKSFLLKPASRLSWTSKYGNVTFGQLGPEFPFGGMNEKGLTAEVLWLTETEEKKDNGPSVNEAQYVQYILDMAQDIDDVVELTDKLTVQRTVAPVHYFICDKSSRCITIEQIKGETIYKHMPNKAQFIENLTTEYQDANPLATNALIRMSRFTKSNANSVEQGFSALNSVETPGWTRWQIVYDINNLEVNFRDASGKNSVKTISLNELNLSCAGQQNSGYALYYDINSESSGNVTNELLPYTSDLLKEDLKKFSPMFGPIVYLEIPLKIYLNNKSCNE